MNAVIEEFEAVYNRHNRDFIERGDDIRKNFVKSYPVENIQDISLKDYLIGKSGFGTEGSFCRRMRYDLGWCSSLGNVRFDIFGIYYDSNGNVALSKTFRKMFGDDKASAFQYIKKEITAVLMAAADDDYERIVSSKLNSSFRYKLITTYYPDKFIPVVTNNVLNEYCSRVGLTINPNEPMIYRNLSLKEWKEHSKETSDWDNAKLMLFCDWLWRSNRYYNHETESADKRWLI